jgi:hypothetical protein
MTTSKTEKHYCDLLNRVQRELSKDGFDRVGDEFAKAAAETCRLIGFQRSSKRRPGWLKFTINVGVISKRIAGLMDEKRDKLAHQGHVVKRIGFLLPRNEDVWWTLSARVNLDMIFAEVVGVLNLGGLPFLNRLDSDSALRQFLWDQVKTNSASYEEHYYLSILEAAKGTENDFCMATEALKVCATEIGFSPAEIELKLKDIVHAARKNK